MTNDAIKLDGNMDLDNLYNELISNISFEKVTIHSLINKGT